MRLSLTAVILLACSAAVSAQQPRWIFEPEEIFTRPDPIEITLSAFIPPSDYAFAGARLDLIVDADGAFSDPTLLIGRPGTGTSPGVVTARGVSGIIVGQLHIGPLVADPASPIEVWSGVFQFSSPHGATSIRTVTSDFRIYPHESSPFSLRATPQEAVLRIIPAPSALATLAIGLAVVSRRRRHG